MTTIAHEPATEAQTPPPARRRRSALRRRNALIGWSFILPNFLGFGFLTLVPVLILFYMAFTNWNVFGKADWVGIANFQRLLGDGSFHIAFWNTLYYSVLHIPLTIVVSLGLALLLNNKLRGVAFFRTAAFFPYITSIVAIAVVWNLLFSPDYGPINQVLRAIGIENPPGWLTSQEWAMPAVVIVSTWRDMGYYMILFLAGLQTVPRELHEAARVDGANVWQRFVNVTLPCLRPTMFFVTVMLTINSFKIFDLILVMTDGGPGQATLVLSQFIYRKGFEESQFGYASAAAVVLFVLCIGVTIIQFFWNKRRSV
ncbi:multiple sugar transport system permease protein/alpha-1,4-digalacturonate transport system permease protein [Microbacterium terrae]|uniref:Lactose transport system permease protein LacF n=1 Tax=Microbacterium terrae TaxID=69369 RepID=A0A0M2HEL2_9MICO|nr:sugar ABC transporter permease [Microbacterium terrae]KJL42653.1 Lactose transport system permease protein LacF [Microbacterium terrae]MBP1079083.1 multiple sugar transport system permease protein/alpha-1,4-digalacturonate transport system permease protein [Microbacterium terrae]GLJ98483.1 ABC transporter permease [Microbacterium terrae]